MRRQPWRGHFWQIITGMIEAGERPEAAAAREVVEETGLSADPVSLDYRHCFVIDPELAHRPSASPLILREHTFAVDAKSHRIRLNPEEHEAYAWVGASEAKSRVRFDGNRKAISLAMDYPGVPEESRCWS